MTEPFEIELHLHAGNVIRYTLTEDEIRERTRLERIEPGIAALADESEQDVRTRVRTAGFHLVRRMLDPEIEGPDGPFGRTVTVVDREGAWVVPLANIGAVLFRDPTVRGDPHAWGFVRQGDSG